MAKRKKATTYRKKKSSDDRGLMLLAAAAAIIVGFFAIFSYKSQSMMAIPSPTPNQVMTVKLDSQNGSSEKGTVTLQEVSGKVVVTVNVTGYPKGVTQPAHIHVGSCPNPGAVKFPMTSVLNGESVTTIDTTLAQLKAMGKLAINIHKSVSQSSVYVSCGNLVFN
jgi:hypothetical protein